MQISKQNQEVGLVVILNRAELFLFDWNSSFDSKIDNKKTFCYQKWPKIKTMEHTRFSWRFLIFVFQDKTNSWVAALAVFLQVFSSLKINAYLYFDW